MCAESLSSGFPIRANPQENLKEIRNYLKIIVHECVHMCGHVCECAGVCAQVSGKPTRFSSPSMMCILYIELRL